MTMPSARSAESFLTDVAAVCAVSLSERSQVLRLDADPQLWLAVDDRTIALVAELVRAAAASAPALGELLLSAARGAARVQAVGEGEVVLRWQLVGDTGAQDASGSGNVVPLRAPPRSAAAFAGSRVAGDLVAAFAATPADLAFEPLGESGEILARIRVRVA